MSRLPRPKSMHLVALAACVPCCLPLLLPLIAGAAGGLSAHLAGWSLAAVAVSALVVAAVAIALLRRRRGHRTGPAGPVPLPLVDEWERRPG